jgi:hypothetical protein
MAQSSISGYVKDRDTQKGIEFASIAAYSMKDSVLAGGSITDSKGDFEIRGLSPETYYLRISFLGYQTQTIPNVTLVRNEKKILDPIFLNADYQNLESVDLQGQRITSEFRTEKQSFSAENFEAAQGGTATDVFRNLPGVTFNAEGQLAIRGNSGFVVMINGRPVQGDPSAILGQLPANGIKKVEWISSPSAQYDSEGKAGIINITTVKGATDGLFVQVNSRIGLPSIQNYDNAERQQRYGSDFNLNYVKGKWNLSLGGSYQRIDISGRRDGNVIT